jgi:hypothetical protein
LGNAVKEILMLRSVFAVIAVLAAGFTSSALAAGCNPNDKEVAFFQHGKYGGGCSVLGIGTYINSSQMRMKNDSISSFIVGKDVQVKVCNHASNVIVGSGWFSDPHKCQTFKSSMKSLKDTRVGNDSISSAMIVLDQKGYNKWAPGPCYPGDNSESVTVYQHKMFGGDCRVLRIGTYENSKVMKFKNDSISSIEFGENSRVKIMICQHGNFKGRCEELKETDTNLYDNKVGDNSITSIKVIRRY